MAEGDGQHPAGSVGSREGERSLQEALGAHQVGLETGAERIAAPGDSGSVEAGAAQERIIKDGADGSQRRQFGQHGATYQQIAAQAAEVHEQLVAALRSGAGAYALTEAANVAAGSIGS